MDVVACTPHPGYGSVSIRNGAHVRIVDLRSCRVTHARAGSRQQVLPGSNRWEIRINGKVVFRTARQSSVEVLGGSPNGEWLLVAVDPLNSASLAADGLTVTAVSIHGGKAHTIATGLVAPDYRAWCNGNLVMTAGGDRMAGHHKWLVVTRPPDWHVRRLVHAPGFAFGALACRGNGIVVQATPNTLSMQPRWQLWSFGLEGGMSVLDRPPPGYADDSPRVSRDGKRVLFVRSHDGHGVLYTLGGDSLFPVGYDSGDHGHRAWTNVTWSQQP